MSKRPRVSQSTFATELATIHQGLTTHRSEIEQAARRLEQLLAMTNAKAVLEKMIAGKAEFMTEGPYAGTFLTEGFIPKKALKTLSGPFKSGWALELSGLKYKEASLYDAAQTQPLLCFSIDPAQPDFFQKLETFLVESRLPQRTARDERSAAFREQKLRAKKEAQKELWGGIAPATERM